MAPSEAAAAVTPPERLDRTNAAGSRLREAPRETVLEAWKYGASNGVRQNQQGCSSSADLWAMRHSQLDARILTQALQRELSSRKEFSARREDESTPQSLAEILSHCFSSQALSRVSPASNVEAKSQLHQNSELLRALQECDSGDTRSFMSTSDANERRSLPGSPLNNSCANSSSAMAAGEAVDSEPTLSSVDTRGYSNSTQLSEEMNTPGFGSTAPRFGTNVAAKVSPGKLEEQAQVVFAGKDFPSSAIPSTWVRTGCDRPQALGAQTSVGAGTAKISKRRSRASSKAPITVLSTDKTNFKAMVQKLTGIPSPLMQQSRLHWWGSPSSASVPKPQTQHIQDLPTLDTSAFLLFDGASAFNQDPRLIAGDSVEHGFCGLSFLQTSQGLNAVKEPTLFSGPSAMNSDVAAHLPNFLDPFQHKVLNQLSASPPLLWDSTENVIVREGFINDILRKEHCPERLRDASSSIRLGESLNRRGAAVNQNASNQNIIAGKSDLDMRHAATLERLLMANERMDFDLPDKTLHAVGSRPSCDGTLGNHAPKVKLAHTA